jgi:hypothetical protein
MEDDGRGNQSTGCLESTAASEEMTMTTKRQRKHLSALARAKRLLELKKKRKPLIPTEILRMLAAMSLPPSKKIYQERLSILLGSS